MHDLSTKRKLPKKFYTRPVLDVAPDLLGKILVRKTNDKIFAGRIVEVEAYDGAIDEAAHTFGGLSERNKVMFEAGGLLYVYFIYGVHHCCNVVAGKEGVGQGILIRGLEPLVNIEQMYFNRFNKKLNQNSSFKNIANGPGKICKALNINMQNNATDLTGDEIYLLKEKNLTEDKIEKTERIGISKSKELLWRFSIKDNEFVSKR